MNLAGIAEGPPKAIFQAPRLFRGSVPLRRCLSNPVASSSLARRPSVKELVQYLLQNLYLDFQGEISLDTVRGFLKEDDGREARALLRKLVAENGVDDMLITLADCLREHLATGVNEKVVRDQLSTYSDS